MSKEVHAPDASISASQRYETLKAFVAPYQKWYWDEVYSLHKKYAICYWVGLCAGFLATILAAIPANVSDFTFHGGNEIAKWLVVVFSAMATLVTGTLTPRYKRMLDDRDKGRLRLDALIARLEAQDVPEDMRKEISNVIDEVARIEEAFGAFDHPTPDNPSKDATGLGALPAQASSSIPSS